jgi:hypothetical protein
MPRFAALVRRELPGLFLVPGSQSIEGRGCLLVIN